MNKKKLLIIDGYGFVFRAYHVQPPLTTKDGKPVGAIYGFTSMLIKLLSDFKDIEYLVVVFDTGTKNFRHEIYGEYKANRGVVDNELLIQLPMVRKVAKSLNLPIIEQNNVEADDVIATLVNKAKGWDLEVIIVSSDKDLMQLIDDVQVTMYDPLKAKYITIEEVVKKFGVGPRLVHDMLALIGDTSDNIPGAKGIGPKTALSLLNKFSNLEDLLQNKDKIENPRIRQLVSDSAENIILSWKLTTLHENLPLVFELNDLKLTPPNLDKITSFLKEYDFRSLIKRVESLFGYKIDFLQDSENTHDSLEINEIDTKEEFDKLYKDIKYYGVIGIYLLQQKNVNNIFFIVVNEKCYTINFNTISENLICNNLFEDIGKIDNQFFLPIKNIIEDISIKKITFNLKSILRFCTINPNELVSAKSCEDLELMRYCLTAGLTQKPLFDSNLKGLSKSDIVRQVGNVILNFEKEYQLHIKQLLEEKVFYLYKEIDLPLSYILYKMEAEGITIDLAELHKISQIFGKRIEQLEHSIYDFVGEEFNIASVRQLGDILFNKLKLPFGKASNKIDAFSTSAEILDKLSIQGYEIADLILKWRSVFKLKSTYADSLPSHLNPRTGRIHTCFLQTSTSTSRLSSQDPNLQNIPVRNKEGGQIRGVFVARPNYKFVSADYSQIELRILAHIADIQSLKQAFINNVDIHTDTAMRIFDLREEELTSEHRRKAKAMNFGIIYGISAFGLAKQLNISNQLADEYIKKYFLKYPGIKEYMNNMKTQAKEQGYVTDLLGRRCYVPLINEKKSNLIQIAERAAINAPIQGTNAEIIKIAMINISKALWEKKLQSKLILQIHDELLFEVPENEVNIILPLIKNIMENSYTLTVPLLVDIKIGNNWQNLV